MSSAPKIAGMQIVPLSAFSDNYIWAIVVDGHCVVVDPGDAEPVQRFLAEHELVLDAILITHHHGDHTGGIAALSARHHPKVFGPATEAIAGLTDTLTDGATLNLLNGALPLSVIAVPGHTAGHIAYLTQGALFCGDTLFSAGCGRLFEGTPAQMHASLGRLAALPDDTKVFCAHEYTLSNLRFAMAVEPGNADIVEYNGQCEVLRAQARPTIPTTIGMERRINPFLRCEQPGVRRAAEQVSGETLADAGAVFAALRRWKNEFR